MSESADTIHILHVDDEPDFAEMVATFLERENGRLNIQTTTNPTEGMDILAAHDVDCIVSDYDMPRTNGINRCGLLNTGRGHRIRIAYRRANRRSPRLEDPRYRRDRRWCSVRDHRSRVCC